MSSAREKLEATFNHVVLPPRLPGKEDPELEKVEKSLLARVLQAVDVLIDSSHGTSNTFEAAWDGLRQSLHICRTIHDGQNEKETLMKAFANIQSGSGIILHITEQNAGLLIRRESSGATENVSFEAFEASPMAENVLASPNALQCDFPGGSVSIPLPQFLESAFLESLATFLGQASVEPIKRFAAYSRKAAVNVVESRDTAEPSLITQMLMTLLEAHGSRSNPPILQKRVRDDVCWDHSEKPWRRSAFWLVLRVSVQRLLCFLSGPEEGRIFYKFLQCVLLSHLLQDCLGKLSVEQCHILRAKLCRRLAKLERERENASRATGDIYKMLFHAVGPVFRTAIQKATEQMNMTWNSFKGAIQRPIPTLPFRADDGDLCLKLPNSAFHLGNMLDHFKDKKCKLNPSQMSQSPATDTATTAALKTGQEFAQRYFSLTAMEMELERISQNLGRISPNNRCSELATIIEKYMDQVLDAYNHGMEEKSVMMLNLFEVWVAMDECALDHFPLLKDYHPGFRPEILDVLQLSRLYDMSRLRRIQNYLSRRCGNCQHPAVTIFADPAPGCFAVRYFYESEDAARLKELKATIERDSEAARGAKERELQTANATYESLSRGISSSSCRCRRLPDGTQDVRGCEHCYMRRKRKRLRITVHEDLLPSSNSVHKDIQQKAILFELAVPTSLAAYRDTTWRILSTFGLPNGTIEATSGSPTMLLPNYDRLKAYGGARSTRFGLASKTKSFLTSHYSNLRLPASTSQVLLPMGLTFSYYDMPNKRWTSDLPGSLTFAPHFKMDKSVLTLLKPRDVLQFAPDGSGPSSYEIIARQTKCPSQLTVHEFSAYQSLLSGKNCRWLSMLRELASSNLNFSLEATMRLYNYLALQSGPINGDDELRMIHVVFKDPAFCTQLTAQIKQRLEGISCNWRESHCMETLLTLILRVCTLGSGCTVKEGLSLLREVRATTLQWTRQLRDEVRNAVDTEAAESATRYALLAALLCKRTFSMSIDDDTWDPGALCCFFEACISVQESLVSDPSTLPPVASAMFIRDLKMTFRMRDALRKSVIDHFDSLESAINQVWPRPADCSRTYGTWKLLSSPWEWWMVSTVAATRFTDPQVIHYHLLEGYLLVDHKPLGKLPREIRESAIVQELFGNQHLLTFPSAMSGMTYMLATPRDGHQIHLGFRDGKLVIRAGINRTILEFVDRTVFGDSRDCDLPAPLVQDCVHWLDLASKRLEFRRRPDIWKHDRPGNWVLDVKTRKISRRQSLLVDPHSGLFHRIAAIFQDFEDASKVVVLQPLFNNLTVELRRLDLQFRVNRKGLLQSQQLHSEIDPNQDAGTWYGLESKIVLRDARNPLQRSIIVPIGPFKYHRHGPHVAVRVVNDGRYGRYTIDDVLGRLHSESEPLLLYLKAKLHAYTSFVLPDPLTGRSGTEEALACLSSASNQPWTSLSVVQWQTLISIARLTPKRQYYPKDLRRLQIVTWDPELTTTIQHDRYRTLVEAITGKLETLSIFTTPSVQMPKSQSDDIPYLRNRGYARRRLYERPDSFPCDLTPAKDHAYPGRDLQETNPATRRVSEITHLLYAPPPTIHTTTDLVQILQKTPFIKGYGQTFSKPLLSDLLETDIGLEWGALVNLCRSTNGGDRYHLMFQLGVMAFGTDVNMNLLRSAIAFFLLEGLRSLGFPTHACYEDFRCSQKPTQDALVGLIRPCCRQYHINPKPRDERPSKRGRSADDQARKAHEDRCDNACEELAQLLLQQWPCPEPVIDDSSGTTVDIAKAQESVLEEWLRLFRNWQFSHHLTEVQKVLNRSKANANLVKLTTKSAKKINLPVPSRGRVIPSLSEDLIQKHGPNLFASQVPSLAGGGVVQPQIKKSTLKTSAKPAAPEIEELKAIVNSMVGSPSPIRKEYGEDLKSSLAALEKHRGGDASGQRLPQIADLDSKREEAKRTMTDHFETICNALSAGEARYVWLQAGNLWPCLTPTTLLQQLRTTTRWTMNLYMKEALLAYAVSITRFQHLLRIFDANRKQDGRRLQQEHANPGHGNWRPQEYPDWLLLEIDGNMLIRDDQVDVARATISPASGSNSVLQMNMGQGKTSVIMPMVACVLANGRNLARLIVPKALLTQTAQILQSRLGGLLGREIRHVPFSRKTSTTQATTEAYRSLHEELLNQSGIMLTLPEHVLSFMLSGLQCFSDGRFRQASTMGIVQSWLEEVSRDVLDESDFTLAVKTQLIYPSGPQLALDGQPHRWKVAQTLLRLVEDHLHDLKKQFPRSVEVVRRTAGGFPFVHFLRPDVENALHQRLVDDICNGRMSMLPVTGKDDEYAIRSFLSDDPVNEAITRYVSRAFGGQPAAAKSLFLVRGLLVHGILLLCLKKRWNVQYGLHPQRDPIAVPFHAKGVPSEQAEWGHPDVAILFTCLAFYYNGLSIPQLRQALQHVLRSDDPSSEYDRWIHQSDTLPDSLRHWNLINIDDDGQIRIIWDHLRFVVVVIDDYLNHFVFPVHAKQFRQKLQASGWDIPLFVPYAQTGSLNKALTTGFSGTNDNRRLLPLTIRQEDLPGLAHTNAEVLTYLLQERNRKYEVAADSNGKRLSEVRFLTALRDMGIRLLIDAGAHILELDNKSLVQKWLEIDHSAPAAVYFDERNNAWVMYRNNACVPLLTSPFVSDLEGCLVYLDEAHTRGTDLKFPEFACGALTLSLGQTKDHTVQAAMRLRQLGTSQSVVFIASPEVHQSILDLRKKSLKERADASDVVSWLLEQTCRSNEQLQNLYLAQGYDFCRRMQAASVHDKFLTDADHRAAYLRVLLQPEQQALEQLYGPRTEGQSVNTSFLGSGKLREFWEELKRQQEGQRNSGKTAHHSSAFEEVEQEREVAFQVEEVRKAERPVPFEGLAFPGLHPALVHFAETGELAGSEGYEPIHSALKKTALGQKYKVRPVGTSALFVSTEFTRTIKSKQEGRWHDDLLRPVHWILWSSRSQTAVVIIPEEAECLIPVIRRLDSPAANLLVYAAPITKSMLHFNGLTFYSLPELKQGQEVPGPLIIELGIFAGRLYFEFSEYADISRCLGQPVPCSDGKDAEKTSVASENVHSDSRTFTENPIGFLEEWFAMTRKGQDFGHTPMGYLCQGRPLWKDHPFFTVRPVVKIEEDDESVKYSPSDESSDIPGTSESDDDDWESVKSSSSEESTDSRNASESDDDGGTGKGRSEMELDDSID